MVISSLWVCFSIIGVNYWPQNRYDFQSLTQTQGVEKSSQISGHPSVCEHEKAHVYVNTYRNKRTIPLTVIHEENYETWQ